jgi:hypothetical protein
MSGTYLARPHPIISSASLRERKKEKRVKGTGGEGDRCGILVRFMMGHWALPDVGECSMMTDRLAARYNHSSVMASPPLKSWT